jgi:predicted O-linked N-acetylglucosamine transferase (SPINDLY family)
VVEGWDHVPSATLMAGVSPLSLANLIDDPIFQLARAWKYNRETIKPVANPRLIPTHTPATRRRWGKLRIGYVSSDLREHAVGFAMTDVLETHDRGQFAVSAYYCGINRVDPTQLRIRGSVDSWVDISGMSDEQAAAKIATDEVDVLVDLNGYTKDARTRIFAFRPVPIVVNWFGFPGTMATPYHHYIIADEHVIPPGGEIYYSEKVLRLACYQPNDRKRQVSDRRPTRSEEGLPETAVVYCCLNGAQKIIPSVFDSWMTILRETPDSVLWLLGNGDDMEARLKGVAESGGVSPERLVFARKKANPEHLARYVLADLFLDTFPYGAHTTAADAIWMGVPVLTTPGKTFASRVCASLAHAAGIGELVCPNPESYVARAIELGRDSGQLLKFKQRLAAKRNTSLLFDTPRLVRDLEDLYRGAWEEFQQGRLPVPDLANLEIYHEIGVELSLANAALAADEDYRRIYCDRLGTHNALCPLPQDSRLWKGASA